MNYKILILSSVFILFACKEEKKAYTKITGEAQGTTFSIIYKDSLERDFSDSIAKILSDFDDELSTYKSNSLISKYNRNEVNLDLDSVKYFKECYERAIYWRKRTKGYFDPVIKHLITYAKKNDSVSDRMLNAKRDFITLNSLLVKLDSIVEIDFNAIAQGYSVDVLASFLSKKGIKNYMVEIGGEMRLSGVNDKDQKWQIGLETPDSKINDREFQEIISLTDASIATSGSYRKFKKVEGKRYSHAINPFTGKGVSHNLLSVSVITDNCIDADALATAFLVMGEEKSMNWLKESNNEVSAFFITFQNGEYVTTFNESFKKYLFN